MSDDHISRNDAKRLIADIQLAETPKDKPRTVYQSGVYEGLDIAYGAIASMRPADVIPRATIESGIGEAVAMLNAIRIRAINGEGQLDYQAYSELHDAITGILPEKEVDSDG